MHLQTTDARQRPAAVGDDDADHDLVGTRRVGHARFHRVEVAAHEGGVLVTERHVDGGAEAAALVGRRHERGTFFDGLAQRRAELRVQDRGGVFQLAGFDRRIGAGFTEIMVAVAVTDSGRPLPRVGGLTKAEIKGEDGLR